jgi:hypothetical protein
MNDPQRLKHDSNLAVRTVCNKDANRALWSSLPAWTTIYDRVLAKISYVNACVLTQLSDTSGVTQAKKDARARLTDSILETAGALCGLALLREDPVLEAKTDLNPTDITELADALVDDKGTELLQLAAAIPAPAPGSTLPTLIDVGLTPGKLDLLETRIETYNLLLGTPRAARGTKTAATENLDLALDDLDRLFQKGLDKLILQWKGTTFYQEYLSARDPIAVARKKQENNPPTGGTAPPP